MLLKIGANSSRARKALESWVIPPYLLSARSVLFPTSMMMTSLPRSVLTSSIHFVVCWKEFTSIREQWRGLSLQVPLTAHHQTHLHLERKAPYSVESAEEGDEESASETLNFPH